MFAVLLVYKFVLKNKHFQKRFSNVIVDAEGYFVSFKTGFFLFQNQLGDVVWVI